MMFSRWFIQMMARILVYLMVLMSVMYFLQDSLMFFPERFSHAEGVEKSMQLGLVPWPEGEVPYRGFISLPEGREFRGTIVVFHGNAGEATDRTYYVHALQPQGYRVVLHEYPGYGAREGKMDEQSMVEDACMTLALVKEHFGGSVYLFGESIGSAVVAGVIANCPVPVAGAALITPWDNLPDLAQQLYWFLPVKWLVRDRYDNRKNLQAFSGKVAILYADSDSIIPPAHAQRLYESISAEKKLWVFENADHNSWPAWPDASWWEEVMQFLDQE
jgi:alpha-beta hydrolase superfamily lysophospholipase